MVYTREDMTHAWYDETGEMHPFDRSTSPINKKEFRLNDPWYINFAEKDGQGWGANRSISWCSMSPD